MLTTGAQKLSLFHVMTLLQISDTCFESDDSTKQVLSS